MIDNTQTNWNVVRIVYGSRDPSIMMVDKEHTYLFHWNHSLDKCTKQLFKPKLQDEHKALCHQYKNGKSLRDADIHSWWLSFGVIFQASVHKLAIGLAFGIFMSEVSWSM